MFSTDKGEIPLIQTQYANSSISNIDISTEGIIKLLNQLNPKKPVDQITSVQDYLKKHHQK